METNTNLIDKSGWPLGPWLEEPDRVQWQYRGYSCLIVRSEVSGALCGYVGVAEGHPWYGKDYEDLPDVEVHGGLTYSRFRTENPQNSEQEKALWWLGFDCAHSGDYLPGMAHVTVLLAEWTMMDSGYMDLEAVRWETEFLVMQALKAAT